MEVANQVYIETYYDGVNVGAIVTPTGVIGVDVPSYAKDARDWAARMHRLSPYPVQQLILTDASGDRVLNTRWLNAPLMMHQFAADSLRSYEKKYPQAFIESLSQRNPHRGRELNNGPVEHPTMSFSGEIVMFKHGQRVILKHAGAPTKGGCWVILPERGILFAGDTLMINTHPHLASPSSKEWIASLIDLKEMIGKYRVVPGRGERATEEGIDASIAYLQEMREVVSVHIEADKPRDMLQTALPRFLGQFPLGTLPAEWVMQQIRLSLGYLYDEVKSEWTGRGNHSHEVSVV